MRDAWGRDITYLRFSVTELCNLRCRYCMPEEGVEKKRHEEMLTEEEMIRAVRAAASLGIWKVRVTGGEPLLKPNVLSICSRISQVEGIREVCLTTNGTLLSDKARALRESGVRRVNISLDTLDAEKYRLITRRDSLKDALAGIEAALDAGFEKVKLNTVLIGGFNDDEILALANLTYRWPLDVRFIELMPASAGCCFDSGAYLSGDKVLEQLPDAVPVDSTIHREGNVARLYRLPGAQGSIGLINPVSRRFCSECSRLRLTADGHLKPCLHTAHEVGIKGMDEEGMRATMMKVIAAKPRTHPEFFTTANVQGRTMNRIGG